MTANMKPIDAIRNEMNKRGYDVGLDTNRRDICDLLGISRKSSTKRLCGILRVEYNLRVENNYKRDPISYNLIDIDNPSHFIKFETMNSLSKVLMFGKHISSQCVNVIIENQYIMYYNERKYIISNSTSHQELDPKENFKYCMMRFRQVMKCRGYNVSYKTNHKDMCTMLDLPVDSTKKDICKKLDIQYVKCSVGGARRWRKVKLTNQYDLSHIVEFRSLADAGRKLNMFPDKLNTFYISNTTLKVEYEGNIFKVSFIE